MLSCSSSNKLSKENVKQSKKMKNPLKLWCYQLLPLFSILPWTTSRLENTQLSAWGFSLLELYGKIIKIESIFRYIVGLAGNPTQLLAVRLLQPPAVAVTSGNLPHSFPRSHFQVLNWEVVSESLTDHCHSILEFSCHRRQNNLGTYWHNFGIFRVA